MKRSSLSAKPIRNPHERRARSEESWLRPGEIQISCNQFLAARGLRLEPADLPDTSPADLDEPFYQW
jgi:hypothetical protein